MRVPENPPQLFSFLCLKNKGDIVSDSFQGKAWLHGYMAISSTLIKQVFCFAFFCTPSSNCLSMEWYVYIFICWETFVYSFFEYHCYASYIYQMLNVLVYVNEFILSFFLFCSVLVYHGFTNANIGSWWVGTQLNISITYKHTIFF